MSLKEVFCQDKAISILQKALAGDKLSHAYIFSGAEGVGKFKTAHEWAKLLLCEKPVIEKKFADSCGKCESCRLFEAGSHPDFNLVYKELLEFTKDNKGKKTPVDLAIDVIREFIIEKVSTKPALSRKKVFVISEAERLNTESQNCLLKVLEEPPGYCFIFLLCTRMEKLLPTIKSRCQTISFGLIDEEKIIEKLKEVGLEQKKAQYFARLSEGRLGSAMRWAQLELANANLYQTKNELVNALCDCQYPDALEQAQWLIDKSKDIADAWADLDKTTSKTDINRRASQTLIRIIISALSDAMQLNITPEKDLTNFDQKEQIKNLASRFGPEQAAEKIAQCFRTLRWVEASVNEKLIFEQLLLNLSISGKIKV